MEIKAILWREWLFFKRRFWRITGSQIVSPLLYFLTFGMGLGNGMEVEGQPYLYYLLPGLLAMTTMRNSYTSVSTRISVMRLHEKSFECYLYSPTRMYLLAAGHILAGALRGMYAGLFIFLLSLAAGAGLCLSPSLILVLFLNCLIFSALGFLAAMKMESHYDMNLFTNVVITPMSFLCGTFFSLETMPAALRFLVGLLPLTHTTGLIRELFGGGQMDMISLTLSFVFAAGLGGACVWACYRE